MDMQVNAEELVQGREEDILLFAGLDPAYLRSKQGPCPICGGKDRYRWRRAQADAFCNRCRHISFFTLLMHLLGSNFMGAAEFVRNWAGKNAVQPNPIRAQKPVVASWDISPEEEMRLREKYRRLWHGGVHVQSDDPVDRYLRARIPGLESIPNVLRFERSMEYWVEKDNGKFALDSTHPGMIAAVQAPDDRVCNIWRTYLTHDGGKADVPVAKKAAGKFLAKGGAVRLFEPMEDELGVAEGIENALKAYSLFGIPTWACLNAGGVANFVLPGKYAGKIKKLRIFGDNDEPDIHNRRAGNDACKVLKEKADAAGLRATIILPKRTDFDLVDIVKKR